MAPRCEGGQSSAELQAVAAAVAAAGESAGGGSGWRVVVAAAAALAPALPEGREQSPPRPRLRRWGVSGGN